MKKLVTLIIFIWFGFASISYAQSQDEKERTEMIDKHAVWMHLCFGNFAQIPPFNEYFGSEKVKVWSKSFKLDDKFYEYKNALEVDRSSGCAAAQSFMIGFFFSKIESEDKKDIQCLDCILDIDKLVKIAEAMYRKSSPPITKAVLNCARDKWKSQNEIGIFREHFIEEIEKLFFGPPYSISAEEVDLTFEDILKLLRNDKEYDNIYSNVLKAYDWDNNSNGDHYYLSEEFARTKEGQMIDFIGYSVIEYCW